MGFFTSSPCLWLTKRLCGFLSSVSAYFRCSKSDICFQIYSNSLRLFFFSSVGGGDGRCNPDVTSMNKPWDNTSAEYSQYGDECNFLPFPQPGIKNALHHLSSSVKNLWFWHIRLPQKCFKPLYACPSSHRNTCFKFVCLPLPSFSSFPSISSTWSLGMFTLKLVFQDSSSFLSSISKSSVLFEGLPCHLYILSVCTSVSFCLSDERLEHSWEWASGSTNTSQTWLWRCYVSFSTLYWQWVSTLTFKFQVYSEVFCKWGSQPKCQDFQLRIQVRFFKRFRQQLYKATPNICMSPFKVVNLICWCVDKAQQGK